MNIENKRVIAYVADATVRDITVFRLELIGICATGVSADGEMSSEISDSLPDAVVIDLDLPDGAGLFWVEKLAAEECTSQIPIVCLSKQGDLQQAETAFKAGARAFLVAPYDPILLQKKLLQLMQQAAATPNVPNLAS